MTEGYISSMTNKQTVTIRLTIPEDLDAREFALSVLEDWYEANSESFPEITEEVEFEIITDVSLEA